GQFVPRDRRLDERRDRREASRRFSRDRRRLRVGTRREHKRCQHGRGEAGFHGIQYILRTLQGDSRMRQRRHLSRGVLAVLLVAGFAVALAAQTGRVGGTVKDEAGQPIKGATITADNPNASPSSFTATTDDKGRFSIIGLKSGQWTFTA